MATAQPVNLECALSWRGPVAHHRDRGVFVGLGPWTVDLPAQIAELLRHGQPGGQGAVSIEPGALLPGRQASRVHRLARKGPGAPRVTPHPGRFYPRGLFPGLPGVQPGDGSPLHCLEVDGETVLLDLNHPLSGCALEAEFRVLGARAEGEGNAGGGRHPVLELCERGAGLQTGSPLCAGIDAVPWAFSRADESPDADFYHQPRLVHHLDATARREIAALYGRFLEPGAVVLDLMSSWVSHLPETPGDLEATGLGMNPAELAHNPRLVRWVAQDLNQNPELPFPGGRFDVVLCTVSVEYLTRPVEVFREVARVLRPGGWFVVTFSDRWFPPKAIRLWLEMHPFERMGLVLDYFRLAGGFSGLASESLRGLPRPSGDAYGHLRAESDPVFAVWGQANAR